VAHGSGQSRRIAACQGKRDESHFACDDPNGLNYSSIPEKVRHRSVPDGFTTDRWRSWRSWTVFRSHLDCDQLQVGNCAHDWKKKAETVSKVRPWQTCHAGLVRHDDLVLSTLTTSSKSTTWIVSGHSEVALKWRCRLLHRDMNFCRVTWIWHGFCVIRSLLSNPYIVSWSTTLLSHGLTSATVRLTYCDWSQCQFAFTSKWCVRTLRRLTSFKRLIVFFLEEVSFATVFSWEAMVASCLRACISNDDCSMQTGWSFRWYNDSYYISSHS
jgi:hypothetical protein